MSLKGKKDRKNLTEHTVTAPGACILPENQIQEVFSKARIITYIWIIFFTPYGLFRVWGKGSTFRRSEKWVWTMIAIIYLFCLAKLIITG